MRLHRLLKIETSIMIVIFLLANTASHAQNKNDLKPSFRMVFDNDFMNYKGDGTDRYYTNGLQFQYSYPKKKEQFFASHLLLKTGNDSEQITHWALTQLIFTPDNIQTSKVLYRNRPYAGTLYLTRGRTSFNNTLKLMLHSEINLGVIGPLSLARNAQTFVHKMFHYIHPNGWDNQVKSDVVLNYNIETDKLIFDGGQLQGHALLAARAGSLYNDVSLGFGIKAGKLYTHPYDNHNNDRPAKKNNKAVSEMYFFINGQVKRVLENAVLQGGFIQSLKNNRSDFYHVDGRDMKRIVSTYETGVVINLPKWGFSLSQNFISPEFKTATTQLFGRIGIYRYLTF
jgi:hypothetical protein